MEAMEAAGMSSDYQTRHDQINALKVRFIYFERQCMRHKNVR